MANSPTTMRGVVHGKTIEVEGDLNLPETAGDGHRSAGAHARGGAAPFIWSLGGRHLAARRILERSASRSPTRATGAGPMSFLVDTDICSAHLRGDRSVFSRFMQHTGQLSVSAITAGELYSWTLRSKAPPDRLQALQQFLMGVAIMPVDLEVSYQFGVLRANLLDRGQPRMSTDLFIAATALIHGLTLVTHNARHFQNIPGLVVEDWIES